MPDVETDVAAAGVPKKRTFKKFSLNFCLFLLIFAYVVTFDVGTLYEVNLPYC
ncbi:hypothetical protein RchiOBHm_Chr4g0390361 [Rosa chinensis]|uniref:Uncharacterized protein n=1 Tax=Rosa chinensis TaxID=74649 RepID=A0A2P6QQ72_ROSCH|nr:hypothetical protein RchiOBHm_Chr4g0390361 [Rosa chinensis]